MNLMPDDQRICNLIVRVSSLLVILENIEIYLDIENFLDLYISYRIFFLLTLNLLVLLLGKRPFGCK